MGAIAAPNQPPVKIDPSPSKPVHIPQKFKKWKRGSNYTPPKKKRNKSKKTHR